MQKPLALALTGVAIVTALAAGSRDSPAPIHPRTAAWYAALDKPSFTPPGPVFGIVWPILDALLWFAGFRLATRPRSPARSLALLTWLASVVGIGGYSYVFFGRKQPGEALGVTAGMLGASAGLVASAARVDPPAAIASAPLVAWLLFANVLQEEVWRRNR